MSCNIKSRVEVAIIGAGMAGSSAAEFLNANGITNIALIEARDRVGGRMFSVLHNNSVLDLGAQWITGITPNNSVYNLATKLNIVKGDSDEIDSDNGYIYYALQSEGIPISSKAYKIAESIHHDILENIDECHLRNHRHGGSIKSFYEEQVLDYVNRIEEDSKFPHVKKEVVDLLKGMMNVMRSYVGGEPEDCSVDLFGTSIELPGGEMPVNGGVGQIIDRLVSFLPEKSIILNSPVEKIDWSNPDSICITLKGSKYIIADYVISTIPLGVLKAHHQTLFHPNLNSKKVDAIQKFSCGQICKIFLEWDQPWWTKLFGGFTLSRKDKDILGNWTDCVGDFSRVKDHPSLLLTWVVGKYSPQIDEMKDEEIIDGLMMLIKKYTGDPSIERASRIIRHRWNTDPYTLGGYSFPSVASSSEDIYTLSSSLPNDETPRIFFAGEAACPNYWSYMHGARTSGLKSAEKIVELLKKIRT